MRFKNKSTGVIIGTSNEFVIEQMKKSAKYEELKVAKKEVVVEENDDELVEEKPKKKKADKEEI